MTEDLFVREDLSKPENRINVSLFGLLAVSRFREWFLARLGLPAAAVVYPSVNVVGAGGSIRPGHRCHPPSIVMAAEVATSSQEIQRPQVTGKR